MFLKGFFETECYELLLSYLKLRSNLDQLTKGFGLEFACLIGPILKPTEGVTV